MFRVLLACAVFASIHAFKPSSGRFGRASSLAMQGDGLKINMKGKVPFF